MLSLRTLLLSVTEVQALTTGWDGQKFNAGLKGDKWRDTYFWFLCSPTVSPYPSNKRLQTKNPQIPAHLIKQSAPSEGEHVAGIQELQGHRHVIVGLMFFVKEDIRTCRQYQDFCMGMEYRFKKKKKKDGAAGSTARTCTVSQNHGDGRNSQMGMTQIPKRWQHSEAEGISFPDGWCIHSVVSHSGPGRHWRDCAPVSQGTDWVNVLLWARLGNALHAFTPCSALLCSALGSPSAPHTSAWAPQPCCHLPWAETHSQDQGLSGSCFCLELSTDLLAWFHFWSYSWCSL